MKTIRDNNTDLGQMLFRPLRNFLFRTAINPTERASERMPLFVSDNSSNKRCHSGRGTSSFTTLRSKAESLDFIFSYFPTIPDPCFPFPTGKLSPATMHQIPLSTPLENLPKPILYRSQSNSPMVISGFRRAVFKPATLFYGKGSLFILTGGRKLL